MLAEPLLDVKSVSFRYRRDAVLRDVSLTVGRSGSVAITGRSGSGKSTLAAIASTLLRPQAGAVMIAGQETAGLRPAALAAFRRTTIGMVFQSAELIPTMTAVENVALPMLLGGVDGPAARRRAETLLDDLQVDPLDTPARTLSGGEAQRVGIARALANDPVLIVADEPTAALDGDTKEVVADMLYAACRARGAALLVVSHDPAVASRADRVLRLADGVLAHDLVDVL